MLLVLPLPSGPTKVILNVREGATPNAACLAYSCISEVLSFTSNLSTDTNIPLFLGQTNSFKFLNVPSVFPNLASSCSDQ